MFYLDRGGQLASRPTPNALVSGGWANNDLTQSTQPTTMDPDWVNAVTAELIGVILASGQTPSKTNVAQLLQAIQTWTGFSNFAVFTVSGATVNGTPYTWTNGGNFIVPSGKTLIKATGCWGAGGGGGGSFGSGSCGSAAGGGGFATGVYAVTSGQTLPITVGTGGAGGTNGSSPGNGGSGGTSSVGSLCSATGGIGGSQALNAIQVTTGGSGGHGVGGNININGISGGFGIQIPSAGIFSSVGGAPAAFFPSNIYEYVTTITAGLPGAIGGGGNGGIIGGVGGNGGAGLIFLEY